MSEGKSGSAPSKKESCVAKMQAKLEEEEQYSSNLERKIMQLGKELEVSHGRAVDLKNKIQAMRSFYLQKLLTRNREHFQGLLKNENEQRLHASDSFNPDVVCTACKGACRSHDVQSDNSKCSLCHPNAGYTRPPLASTCVHAMCRICLEWNMSDARYTSMSVGQLEFECMF